MTFKVPYDSSPPSTPGKSRSIYSNLSTTPAGAPPSASNSFTPHGAPPSTVFGSSQLSSRFNYKSQDSPNALFTKSGGFGNDSIFGSSVASDDYAAPPRKGKPAPKSFAASQSLFSFNNGSQFGQSTNDQFGSSQMEQDADDGDFVPEDEADGAMDTGLGHNGSGHRFSFLDSQLGSSIPPQSPAQARKPIYTNPTNAKRPKLDEKWASQSPLRRAKLPPKKDSAMPSIVRNFASRSRPAPADEPDNLIIKTEDQICNLWDEASRNAYKNVDLAASMSEISSKLCDVWSTLGYSRQGAGIGPGDGASSVAKAGFLGSLLLKLRHPPLMNNKQGGWGQFGFRSLVSLNMNADTFTPIPKVLLDWQDTNHAQPDNVQALRQVGPNPTASPNFWDIIIVAVLRGHLSDAADLLRTADFNYAHSSLDDGMPRSGYRGAQLQNIQRCVNKAHQVLESSPSLQNRDWDIRGAEWATYRKRVLAAMTDLEEFAEGGEQSPDTSAAENRFQAANFGLKSTASNNVSFTQSARMAESRVPWTIYQSLRSMYRILLGDTAAIMNYVQDWVEATIGLTVWWDGEADDGDAPQDPHEAYLHRLDLALSSVTNTKSDEPGFRVNSLSSIEVGLASVFEGNVEGVVELLQTWSLCIASAVTEVAATGGWLQAEPNPYPGLTQDDLMVLSYGVDSSPQRSCVNKDDVLTAYASSLFDRSAIQGESGPRQGWELALEVLSRLDENKKMQKSVSDLVDRLPLHTEAQMDRVVLLCSELGLDKVGKKVSERYGDQTIANSEEYGLALVCYARAHSHRKVKSLVDVLISYSLVKSRAYPASEDLDEQLEALVREPKECLSAVAAVDEEGAAILQYYFSGYATLRRFYETRDEAVNLAEGQRPRHKPLARKRAAAQALVAVISSAADSIYGGLYDPDRDTSVQVDGLLTLLGEALAFIEQPTPILTVSQQFTILQAIEDLETVTKRVYAQCEECFHSTLMDFRSSHQRGSDSDNTADSYVLPPSPRALLKKSVSAGTGPAASTFSFIGNDMMESARTQSGGPGSTGSSGVLVPRPDGRSSRGGADGERGWDWRAGVSEDARGEEVLRKLRLGLARGLSLGVI